MAMFRIDDNAHAMLKDVRDDMKMSGISGANLSDAVRLLCSYHDELVAEGLGR